MHPAAGCASLHRHLTIAPLHPHLPIAASSHLTIDPPPRLTSTHVSPTEPSPRPKVELWTVSVFRREVHHEPNFAPPRGLALPSDAWWRQMPSKLRCLLALLHRLLEEAADEHVLIFTQWLSHVTYLAELLRRVGIQVPSERALSSTKPPAMNRTTRCPGQARAAAWRLRGVTRGYVGLRGSMEITRQHGGAPQPCGIRRT